VLAEELDVSLRTLYRDIATLREQGVDIAGEPGVGYVMRPGFLLPPLMFPEEEITALALGAAWVAKRADGRLAEAAGRAMARIRAVLPPGLLASLDDPGFIIAPGAPLAGGGVGIDELRAAIRAERRLKILYRDGQGTSSERTVWPIALAFFDQVRILAAWCEMRGDFRHFRIDRIAGAEAQMDRIPRSRRLLMREWKASIAPMSKAEGGSALDAPPPRD
jgi:predicted DNA-binding transcriptional regulator YafY